MASTEDVLNVAVAVVLAGLSVLVLVAGVGTFVETIRTHGVRSGVVALLDNTLLVLMLVEILHTVGISLREHHLVPEPFLVVALIAAIRRMLVITAELGLPSESKAVTFRLALQELGLLTILVLILVIALIALWRAGVSRDAPEEAEPSRESLGDGVATTSSQEDRRPHSPATTTDP
jgi:uncharacterized membrane protein (DUF373 family)